MKTFQVTTKNSRLLSTYVRVLNGIIGLTDRTLDIFAILIELQVNWPEDQPIDIYSTKSRKFIRNKIYVNKNNLSRYLAIIRDRGLVRLTESGWVVKDKFIPKIDNGVLEVSFKIQRDEQDEREN